MKWVLVFVACLLYLIQNADPKRFKIVVDDELLSYEIDKRVTANLSTIFNLDNLILEQIDDDAVELGGYLVCIKSLDPNLAVLMDIRTKYLDGSTWVEGPIRLILPNVCPEFLNPTRFWYNVSKLWTGCPSQLGSIWKIEHQIVDASVNLPPSIPLSQWRFYVLFTQGLPGFVKHQFGMGFQLEFVLI